MGLGRKSSKIVPDHTMQAPRRHKGTALPILNLSTKWSTSSPNASLYVLETRRFSCHYQESGLTRYQEFIHRQNYFARKMATLISRLDSAILHPVSFAIE
jgi:hypothetical protein